MLWICYSNEEEGYYLLNEMGMTYSCRWFSTLEAAENYCVMNGYDYDYNFFTDIEEAA